MLRRGAAAAGSVRVEGSVVKVLVELFEQLFLLLLLLNRRVHCLHSIVGLAIDRGAKGLSSSRSLADRVKVAVHVALLRLGLLLNEVLRRAQVVVGVVHQLDFIREGVAGTLLVLAALGGGKWVLLIDVIGLAGVVVRIVLVVPLLTIFTRLPHLILLLLGLLVLLLSLV